jgi:hypothetical protein
MGTHGEGDVASLDELIDQFQQAIDQIEQAIGSVGAGEDGADELHNLYASTGAEDKASQLSGIKDGADSWRSYLRGGIDQGNELIERVKEAKGG